MGKKPKDRKDDNQKQVKKSETALREEEVLAFWNKEKIFERSLEKEAPNGEFVFYDGPPFATGLPHWGSLLSSISKDVVGRYKTMRGYRVPRRWGWDCHGLPIENMIEKELGLKSKKDIEELGIDVFNEKARASVLKYADDWKTYVDRVGRWVDFDNSYKTLDNTYVESVWWALKKIHDDGRLYEGRKVLLFCPHCETPLSKAEIAMDNSYKDVTDRAVYVQFKIKNQIANSKTTEQKSKSDDVRTRLGLPDDGKPISILAWTTTPWTLPGNVALAVNPDITYAVVRNKSDGDWYIVAESALDSKKDLWNDFLYERETTQTIKGSELVGTSYEPLYEIEKVKGAEAEKTWTIQAADFVTTEEGTGVVHIAPMYGEDDYNLGLNNKLPIVPLLDATGTFNTDAPELVRGMYYKKGGKYVQEDLGTRGLLFGSHDHSHSYPHCYRCGTALIYNALTSWFIDIQSVKEKLLSANEDVTWYPEHLKHGRFQNIVETAPDWTISRNRFWASPLPIWKNTKTDALTVIGSLTALREATKKSGNTYLVTRHGEADSNVEHIISCRVENEHHITKRGKEQASAAVSALEKYGVTKIIASPLLRTKETAELLASELGYAVGDIVYDERLVEWQLDALEGKPVAYLKEVCPTYDDRFRTGCGSGETLVEMKRRIGEALYEYEQTYKNEVVLIVGHEYVSWMAACVAEGANIERCIEIRGTEDDYIKNAEVRELDFVPLPHNKEYELDLHRPYIDGLSLVATDGTPLKRIKEVVDCWVESGAMPFASEHYPHENEALVKRRYPGDFIVEYIAQTRTWFYYMHALGVLLFGAPSFKNCVTTGNLLASDGAKMSKSKKNYTDPLADMDLYGADAARFYMLGSVVMAAEDSAFKDEELREAHNRYVNMFWNSYKFFAMYKEDLEPLPHPLQPSHVLDRWIFARLAELTRQVTEYMDAYDTIRSARALREFVTDFSTWYVRRSRDRFKGDDEDDREAAFMATRHVLVTLAKLTAPITPYIGESVYRGAGGEEDSVHLAAWPTPRDEDVDDVLVRDMTEMRRIASLVLEVRQREGVKVRQPLASVTLQDTSLEGKDELLDLLRDEVNVKEVKFGSGFSEEVDLDTELTDELRLEGSVRDLVRAVQNLRKETNLVPEDRVILELDIDAGGKEVVEAAQAELARVAGVCDIRYTHIDEDQAIKAVLTLSETTVSIVLARE